HLGEAAVLAANQLRLGAFQGHLPGRHRARPEFVLEPVDAVPIADAVRNISWDQEERETARAGRRALGPGQRQPDLAADVGTEEFLPEQTPAITIAPGDHRVLADIGAALPFGHPLARGPGPTRIAAPPVGQHP